MSEQFFTTFQKHENNPKFDQHLKNLKEMSENQARGEIELEKDVFMPRYGPDPDIFDYENRLKGWPKEDVEDFCFLRDLYFQGAVDSLDFCRLAASHLSSLEEYKDNENLSKTYYALEEEKEPSIEMISELVTSDDEQISTLGASLMMTFFT